MTDLIAQYAVQFGVITAAAMALAQWAQLPVGKKGPPLHVRRRLNALIYAIALGIAGLEAQLLEMPGDGRVQEYLGAAVTGVCAVAAAHLIVTGKKKLTG